MSSSAFSLSAAIPSGAFAVTRGAAVVGGTRQPPQHYFCADCMTWLFTRPPGVEQFVNVRPTLFDDFHALEPFIETYTSEKLPWVRLPVSHSFEKFPPMESYESLLAEFAAARRGA
jgi:hypothetical protein